MYALKGGAGALADALTESIKHSGGNVRFDTTALRLAYDPSGAVAGVELLTGETLSAARAYVSNLTAWDTYGKLVGASRTPPHMRARLKALRGWGAYLVLLGVDEDAAARLPSTRMLALTNSDDADFDPTRDFFALNVADLWDARAPVGRRAATLSTFADAEEWFAYHEDEAEQGDGAEVIETVTPRGYYEQTRRRLGAVWGAARTVALTGEDGAGYRTHLPNLYMVGDTVAEANGVAAVTRAALAVADEIAPVRK
jgi:phytoene dehydrogenase-like protein